MPEQKAGCLMQLVFQGTAEGLEVCSSGRYFYPKLGLLLPLAVGLQYSCSAQPVA